MFAIPQTTSTTDVRNALRQQNDMRLLYEVSMILAETKHIEHVFLPVLEKMASFIGITRGTICILNRITGEIDIAEGYGFTSEQMEKAVYLPGEGITGKVVSTGNPVAIPRISEEPLFLNRTGARDEHIESQTSFICVPIKNGVEVIGTISIDIPYDGEPLGDRLCLLTIIAAAISQYVRLFQVTVEELKTLKEENIRLYAELEERHKREDICMCTSDVMRKTYQQVKVVSGTKATILLLGETGVGKERFAQEIHFYSPRANKPFIKVNCAAIPENLIESALFGHEKGAFTSAIQRQIGYFEKANEGTIFLDEIGELPLPLQAKFLRVIQEREFERVGGHETIQTDVRVIAATNRDLAELVKEGQFREDLYYRLSVFPIRIPPLRERKIDIMMFAGFFAKRFCAEYGKPAPSFTLTATDILNSHAWPGNIRELQNTIERAVILSQDGVIHSYHLPEGMHNQDGYISKRVGTLTEMLESLERDIIEKELRKTNGNMSKAARNLGVTDRILGLRVTKYKIIPKG